MARFKWYIAVGFLLIGNLAGKVYSQQAINIAGTVVDSITSSGIAGATVRILENPSCSTLTDNSGAFTLSTVGTGVLAVGAPALFEGAIALANGVISISEPNHGEMVTVDIFAGNGALIAHHEGAINSNGRAEFKGSRHAAGLYYVKVRIGNAVHILSSIGPNFNHRLSSLPKNAGNHLAKNAAVAFTVRANKAGYISNKITMSSSSGNAGQIRLPPCRCTGLSTSNGWQKITPPGDLGDAQAIELDPINTGTIYVQMHKGGNGAHYSTDGLYKSTNCGTTWNRVPLGRNSSDPGTNINSGSFSGFCIDPIYPDIMYITSNYGPGGVWKSTNGGVDWDQMVTPDVGQYVSRGMWFDHVTMDPTNRMHLAAVNHAGCSGPYAPNAVAETFDGGITWKLDRLPVDWAEGNYIKIKDSLTMMFSSGCNVTTDGGKTWNGKADGATGPDGSPGYYRAADGNYYMASTHGILSSPDFVTWTYIASGQYRNMIGTGTHMIVTAWYAFDYYIADDTNPKTWTKISAPNTPTGGNGGVYMRYEKATHLLYSANFDVGLWRLVQE